MKASAWARFHWMTVTQGKTFSTAMLAMRIEIPKAKRNRWDCRNRSE
jgi:hypothetical protein